MARDDLNNEQRIARRQRVLKEGKILLAKSLSIIDCTIRDLSETGARPICGDQAAIPSEFRLVTKADNLMRDAKVQWRRGGELGVLFTSEPRKAPLRKW